jgi:hypothetical protein
MVSTAMDAELALSQMVIWPSIVYADLLGVVPCVPEGQLAETHAYLKSAASQLSKVRTTVRWREDVVRPKGMPADFAAEAEVLAKA